MKTLERNDVRAGGRRRAALALAGVLLAVAGCKRAEPPIPPAAPVAAEPARALAAIVASCASADGTVEVRRAGLTAFEAVAPGAVFRVGDEVRTGALSSVRIEFLSGGGLELEESAAVVIDTAPPAGAAQPGEAAPAAENRVAVKEGVVRGFLPEAVGTAAPLGLVIAAGDGSELRIAPQAAGKTAFRLARKEKGTELAVTAGRATIRGAGGDVSLAAGQVAVATGGGLSEPAELIEFPSSTAPGIDARFQLASGLAVRLAWKPVAGASAYRVQVATDLSFQRVVMNQIVLDGTEASFRPKQAGMYAWRVASVDGQHRQGEYGFARRLFCEVTPPRDLLVGPADGAVVRFGDALPRVEFSWEAPGEARPCRVVLAMGPDLLAQSAATEIVPGQRAQLRVPAAGEYFWGVYQETEAGPRPLFTRPRRLAVRKTTKPRVDVPRTLTRWGE